MTVADQNRDNLFRDVHGYGEANTSVRTRSGDNLRVDAYYLSASVQ